MLSERVRNVMEQKRLLTAPPQTSVAAAARLMRRRKVGAIMVVDGQSLVGIFTERDALFGVIAGGRNPRTTTLADVMTAAPQVIGPDKSFGHALLVMHQNGFRHLPVIEQGKLIGIVSARNALDPNLEEFATEAYRREQFEREQA